MSKINQLKYEMENLEKRKKQISEEIFLENQKNVFTNLVKGKYYSFKTDSWSKREYIIKYDPDKVYMENDTISGGIAIYFNLPMFVSYKDGQRTYGNWSVTHGGQGGKACLPGASMPAAL